MFHFSPIHGVIIVGGMASVVLVACVVAVTVAMRRKYGHRGHCERSENRDDVKASVITDSMLSTEDGTDGGAVRSDSRSMNVSDDGLDKNPDIIPHDNGKDQSSP